MLIYEGTKDDFLLSVEQDTIAIEIEKNIYERMHRHTAKNEFRAWEKRRCILHRSASGREYSDSKETIEM